MDAKSEAIDDLETTAEEARQLLEALLNDGFDEELDLLAQALGRTSEEIEDSIYGEGAIDEDLLMKARGLAQQRNINIA